MNLQEKIEITKLKKLYDDVDKNVHSFIEYIKENGYLDKGECRNVCGRCFFIERDMEMYKKSIDDLLDEDNYLQIKKEIGIELINADKKFLNDKLNEINFEVNKLRIKWNHYNNNYYNYNLNDT